MKHDALGNLSDDPLNLVPPDLMHLIPGFIERRQEDVSSLGNLLKQSDFRGIQAIGHRLKGTGVGYGFPIISEIGQQIESAAKECSREKLEPWIDQLSAVTLNLKGFLNLHK